MSRVLRMILCLLGLGLAVGAQPVPPTPVLVPTETATPVPALVEEEFASPRASLERFLDTMSQAGPLRPGYYLSGLRHLDLSELPAVVRDERGVLLAQQLHDILVALDLPTLPADPAPGAESVLLYRYPSGQEITMRQQPDGRWLFSAATVQAIPSLHEATVESNATESSETALVDRDYLGVPGKFWSLAVLLPLCSYLSGCLAVLILRSAFRRLLVRYNVSAEQRRAISRPVGYLAASLVFWIGLCLLPVPSGLFLILIALVKVVATLASMSVAFRLADAVSSYAKLVAGRKGSAFDDMLIPLVRRSFKVLIGMFGTLFLAQNLDIEVWSLFAGFSIFGAMVALAGQDIVKNFFGSLTVLGDRPFGVGDWIVVEGIEGTVEDVGFRSTRVRTFYDSLVTVPNSRLITASVDNYGRRNFRRYTRRFMVGWSTPTCTLEAFCEGIRELVRQHPYTRKDRYHVWVNDINEYAIEVLIYIFFAAPDWGTELRERHRFLLDVHRLANELEITIAYPSQRLMLSRKEERPETEFDRELQGQAMTRGRQTSQRLVEQSLPKVRPEPLVVDSSGRWSDSDASNEGPR